MEQIIAKIWSQVAAITGEDLAELHGDMRLDTDLGIDSLKTMSLWNSVLSVLDESSRSRGRERQAEMMAVRTLDELTAFMLELVQASSGQPESALAPTRSYTSEKNLHGRVLPIAHAQRLFLLSHQLVDSASMCSMVRVRGPVDLSQLTQAWQQLVATHISLRTAFYIPQNCQTIQDVEYQLLSDCQVPQLVAEKIQEDQLEEAFFAQLNRTWDIRSWPLHDFHVYQIADDDFAITLANEHIISDGLGNQRLLRSLLQNYQSITGNSSPAATPELSVEDYIAEVNAINNYRDEDEIRSYSEYNKSIEKETCIWDPKGSIGKSRDNYFKNKVYSLPVEKTTRMQQQARELRYPFYTVLLSLWLRALSQQMPDKEKFILQLPTSGTVYPDCALDQSVGCWAQNMSLSFNRITPGQGFDQTLAEVNETLQYAIASGFDRAQTSLMADAYAQGFPMPKGVIPEFALAQAQQSMRSNLYFPYTGQTGFAASYGNLQLADYRAGTCNVAGTLDVLQEIHLGQLTLFANYDALNFAEAEIINLVESYLQQIDGWLTGDDAGALTGRAPAALAQSWESYVLAQAAKVLSLPLADADLEFDLEYDIGVDSLARIRLTTQLAKALGNNSLSRKLIKCRSLKEMANAIGDSAVTPVNKPPAAPVHAPAAALETYPRLDSRLQQIPLRHIEKQAQQTPGMMAVSNQQESISYQQLDARANQLARLLVEQGVLRGDRVAMLCDRGPSMLVAIIGIMKAGAAYVPLDPKFPDQRIEYIINHARVSCLVSEQHLLAAKASAISLPETLTSIVDLHRDGLAENRFPATVNYFTGAMLEQASTRPLVVTIDPQDLMVVLYTSGSTGKPKGVALNHQGYYNRLNWHQNEFRLQPGERVAQKTSCCFDVSVWELLWPLMVGGTVCAVEKEIVSNPWELLDWINAENISVMHFVPSMFNEFVHAIGGEKQQFSALRWLIFSGEALAVATVKQWIDVQGMEVQLANLYGPTEASIDVTCHIISRRPAEDQLRIPIGAAIDNTQMLILDKQGQAITEPGKVGELYIAGIQLAQGYLFDEEKTAQAFVENPFKDVFGEKIYRTGDISCWMENGEIDYRGRIDSQVKLRGFRIELGEIEAVLTDYCGAEEAAALVVDINGQQKLLACYSPASLAVQTLKKSAAEKLTEYMVPQLWAGLDSLPKNANGKLDRNQLLNLYLSGALAADGKSAPQQLPKSPAKSAPVLVKPREPGTGQRSSGLTPAQLGLVQSVEAPFNRAAITRMQYTGAFDVDLFCAALHIQLERHDALRSIFVVEKDSWVRKAVKSWREYKPAYFDGRSLTPAQFDCCMSKVLNECAMALRINQWPLMNIVLAKVDDQTTEVGIVCHQIIGDMVTGNLMCQQLWQAYDQLCAGQTPERHTIASGSDLAERLVEEEERYGRQALIDYWVSALPCNAVPFALANCKAVGENTYGSLNTVEKFLDEEKSKAILYRLTRKLNLSSYAIFSAPLYKILADTSACADVVISHRFNSRNVLANKIYFDSVDGFAVHFPIAMKMDESETLPQLATRFEDALNAVPWRGASYDWVGLDLPARCYPEGRATTVRMNFLGDISQLASDRIKIVNNQSNLRLVDDSKLRPIALEVWLKIEAGRIGVEIGYSENQFARRFIETLIESYFTEISSMLEQANNITIAA